MKEGTTGIVVLSCDLTISAVDSVIWTLMGKTAITKSYPGNVTYNNGRFYIALAQEDTIHLGAGNVSVEGQINYKNKAVGKTKTSIFTIESSLSTTIIEGNNPYAGQELDDIEIKLEGNVLIATVSGGISNESVATAIAAYLAEHPVEGVTESEMHTYVASQIPSLTDYAKKSEIPSLDGYATQTWVESKGYLAEHQQLKTINGENITGSGNITISSGSGDITTAKFIDTLYANRLQKDFTLRDLPHGMIALVLDDCLPAVISLCVTNAQAKNVPLNMSAISSYFDDLCTKGQTNKTVLEEIKRGISNGGEVLLHGNGSITASNITDEAFLKQKFFDEKELFISKGLNPRGAIVIGGGSEVYGDARTDRWVRALYDYSDGWGVGSGYTITEPYYHRRYAPTTLDQAKGYIDSAVANKSFIIIFAHKWYDFWNEMIDYAVGLGAEFTTYGNLYDTYGTTKSVKALEDRIKALESSGSSSSGGSSGGGSDDSGDDTPTTRTLASISAVKTTTTYNVGDTLATNDITVTATYSDSTTATVSATIDTSTVDMSTASTYSIEISYTEGDVTKTTSISITVNAVQAEPETPSGTVIYTGTNLVGNFTDGVASPTSLGGNVTMTNGKSYRVVLDATYTNMTNYNAWSIKTPTSNVIVNGQNKSNGSEHIDKTFTVTGSTRTGKPVFTFNATSGSGTVTLNNITVTELS